MFEGNQSISLKSILNNSAFAEVTQPYHYFFNATNKLIAVGSSFYTQWAGRSVPLRKYYLHLYDVDTLKLVNHLDVLKYPINDVAFHPTESLIVLGIGSYDGGAFYEGELLLWDFKSSKLEKLLEDDREVIECAFTEEGSKLRFTLNPTDDLYGEPPYTITTYEVPFPTSHIIKTDNLSSIAETPFQETFNPTAFQERTQSVISLLQTLAEQKGQVFENRNLIWDLQFLDENTLCAAGNNATVELHNVLSNEKTTITLPAPGDCVELFVSRTKESLYVNLWNGAWGMPDTVRVHRIDTQTCQYKEVFVGQHTFSKSSEDYFLARQTDYAKKNLLDAVLNEHFDLVFQKRLGHYDLFNHYLRIDNTNLLYFLKGKPAQQHENKVICSIDPRSFRIEEVFQLEKRPDHYNDLSGIYTKDHIILGGRVYSSHRNPYDSYEIRAIDVKAKKEKWYKTYSDKATSFGLIEEGNTLIAAFTSGMIEIMEAESGKTLTTFTTQFPDSFPKPLSVATIHNNIAIGLTDGRILVCKVKQ